MSAGVILSTEQQRELRSRLAIYSTRLRLARALRDMSRAQLAAQSDMQLETIAALERGNRGPFNDEARRLAAVLELPIDFFRGTGISSEILFNVFAGIADERARHVGEPRT